MSSRQASYEDDFEEFISDWMEADDDDDAFLYGMYQYAYHIDKHLSRSSIGSQPLLVWNEYIVN